VHDGVVLTGVGQVNNCTFHTAGSPKFTLVEPFQLAALDGLIADGEPHLHAVVSSPAKGSYTGHLENGCVVQNQVEVTLLKLSGTPLIRKKGILQQK
jgi:predicted DNA-binding protein with PD1-like motif